MVPAVPLGAEKFLVPSKRWVSRTIALDLAEEAGIQLDADRAVHLYILDEENWASLRAGRPFHGITHRLIRSHACTFKASSAGTSYIVVYNPNDAPVQVTLLVSI